MFSKIIISVAVAFTAATGVLATPVFNDGAIALQSRQINQFVTICSNAGLNDCDQINFNFGFCGTLLLQPSSHLFPHTSKEKKI